MMKATAIAPANIAFIKYWGKKDEALRLPYNSSISMNLSEAYTTTTVEFRPSLKKDDIGGLDGEEALRVTKHLDRLRKMRNVFYGAKVVTKNTFPASSGIASSASGFAALTVASDAALRLQLSEKELSILARLGSGSACRSIPDGFVEWKEGDTSESSYAHSLYPSTYWDLCDIVVIVDTQKKKISTSKGHEAATSSPFFHARLTSLDDRIQRVKEGLKQKDLGMLGPAIEEEAINMHAVMMTQTPPLFYWNGITIDVMHSVFEWRSEGIGVYFTIDAGPTVHLICEAKDTHRISDLVKKIEGVKQTLINAASEGAHVV